MIWSLLLVAMQPEGLPSCDKEKADRGIQQEMNICAANDFFIADQEMNAAWALARAKMKELDKSYADHPGPPEADLRSYFEILLSAQRAWLKYRDEHCRLDGYRARGGSLEPLLVSTCKTALTEARTKELRELAETY